MYDAPGRVNMAAPFMPPEAEWIRAHYQQVPDETREFCGDLAGKSLLNLGCGEMLTDFGLLRLGVKQIQGLDVTDKPADHLQTVASKLQLHGIAPDPDYKSRILYQRYDGEKFPFRDGEFDFVFSWSAFEHIANVPAVLSEVFRVLRDDGRAFIQVYPWYHAPAGSHLTDYISEPYFHLRRTPDWVRERLELQAAANPANAPFIREYLYGEYLSLNRYSANQFYRAVLAAGFKVVKARIIHSDANLSDAPPDVDFSDLMIGGTKMLLAKGSSTLPQRAPTYEPPSSHEIDAIRSSLSWRITAPLRFFGGFLVRSRGRSRG